jgi:hypothetical protein
MKAHVSSTICQFLDSNITVCAYRLLYDEFQVHTDEMKDDLRIEGLQGGWGQLDREYGRGLCGLEHQAHSR